MEIEHAAPYFESLGTHLARLAGPGVEVSTFGAKPGTWGELQPAVASGAPYLFHHVVKNMFIEAALEAEESGYDALIVGATTDPGLREARSVVDIPIVSVFESSVLVSCTVARQCGIITPTQEVAHILHIHLDEYLLSGRVASWQTLERQLTDKDLNALFSDPTDALIAFLDSGRRAVKDGADAIIPAEGILAELVAASDIREVDGATVIDPVGTALVFAEMQVRLAKEAGLHPGRRWYYIRPRSETIQLLRARK
ncbi:aspartate/glutamate racemase family protein [Paenarthrobacter nicotinovorans]|uniref:aspartate/glutamate racemase family protein n=1 Tax=Paenarthrobacter nicotinovorans TaxID=29320 RepID=UPI0037F70511